MEGEGSHQKSSALPEAAWILIKNRQCKQRKKKASSSNEKPWHRSTGRFLRMKKDTKEKIIDNGPNKHSPCTFLLCNHRSTRNYSLRNINAIGSSLTHCPPVTSSKTKCSKRDSRSCTSHIKSVLCQVVKLVSTFFRGNKTARQVIALLKAAL